MEPDGTVLLLPWTRNNMTIAKRMLMASSNAELGDAGALWGIGPNTQGEIGDGTTTARSSPVQIGSDLDWIAVSRGEETTAMLKENGTLYTTGKNSNGSLGLGDTTNRSSPVQVGSLTTWAIIAQMNRALYGCMGAINTSGQLFTWGGGNWGRLGHGSTTNYSSPVQVGSLTTWRSMSTGYTTCHYVKTDNTLWNCGQGNYGMLGHGNTTSYSVPTQLGSLTNWSYSTNGEDTTTSALKTDGTIWSWGLASSGELGNGTVSSGLTGTSSPVQAGGTGYVQHSGAGGAVHAIDGDGKLWAWGRGANGGLGDGTTVDKSSRVQVGSLTNWLSVSSYRNLTVMAIKTDGTLWTWGYGVAGSLAQGNTTNYSSPVQVGSLTTWKSFDFELGHKSIGIARV